MCEVLLPDMSPHPSNTRAACAELAAKYGDFDTWFGIEQEYTFFDGIKPLGWPDNGFPAPAGRLLLRRRLRRGVRTPHRRGSSRRLPGGAGLMVSGINAEVMPSQWEFQIGPLTAPAGRRPSSGWPAGCSTASAKTCTSPTRPTRASPRGWTPSRCRGDWNGAGAHCNFSTRQMRDDYEACIDAARGAWAATTICTSPTTATASRSASPDCTRPARTASSATASLIAARRCAYPWQVHRDGKGYIEDRRPNANCDPLQGHRADPRHRLRRRLLATATGRESREPPIFGGSRRVGQNVL